ncbi:MAG: TonB-dependent receptor [Bacteroidota bacterium]
MTRRLTLLFLAATAAHAQPATVAGRVTDADSGMPVPGAAVTLAGTDRGTAANADGRFVLTGLDAGAATLVVTAVGYAQADRSVVLVAGDTLRLDLALTPSVERLGVVTVEVAGSLAGGPRGVRDVPGSATVLGPQAVRRFGDTDVHRLLASVPGVSVQEEDGYGLRPNIGIRGTVTDRSRGVTLMEDGVLVAPAPYAQPAAYYFPAAGRMDAVEVRKGSAQIAYGPYTTGGAVNLVSARIPAGRGGFLAVRGGTDFARTLHARGGAGDLALGRFRLGVVVEGFFDGADGFKEVQRFGADAGVLADETGYDLGSVLGKVRLSTTRGDAFHAAEVKLALSAQTSDETYLGLTPADFGTDPFARYASTARDRFVSDHSLGHLRYVGVFGEQLDVTATLYATRFRRDWTRLDAVSDGRGDDVDTDGDGLEDADLDVPINRFVADPVVFADELAVARGALGGGEGVVTSNDRTYGAEGLDLALGLRPGLTGLDLTFGLRLHQDRADRLQQADRFALGGGVMTLAEAGVPGNAGNRIDRARAVAGFAEAEVRRGRLTLTPGLRVEHVRQEREDYGVADPDRAGTPEERENTVTAFIPGLGVRLDAAPYLTLFGGLHRGFAPPSSQPGVEAERSLNAEVGARAARGEAASAQAVVFATWYENLLGADLASSGGTGSGDLFNGGAARVLGAEVSVEADALALVRGPAALRLPVRLAYTFTDARFQSSFRSGFLPWGTVRKGDRIPYVAPHVVSVGVGLATDRLHFDLRANGTAATRDRAGQGTIPESERIDARLLFDASAEAALPVTVGGARLSGTVTVRNLTDEVYVAARRPAGLRPGLPRTLLFGLRAEL